MSVLMFFENGGLNQVIILSCCAFIWVFLPGTQFAVYTRCLAEPVDNMELLSQILLCCWKISIVILVGSLLWLVGDLTERVRILSDH